MFTRLRLKNFKAWWDTENLVLRPVTMLLGTNSSGKSSLIQSLLLLKQTALSPDRTVHLNLGGDEVNDLFSFGSFEDVLNQKPDTPRQFTIEFDFKRESASRVDAGSFSCSYGQTSSRSIAIQSLELSTGQKMFRAQRREKGAYSIHLDNETQAKLNGRNGAPERSIAFSVDAIAALDGDGQLIEDLSLSIRRELESICYLGPLRRKPERDYPWNRTKPGDIGIDGKGTIDALLASALLKSEEHNYILDGVSKWLNRMGMAERLEVKQQGRSNRYELNIHRGNTQSNLRDVGIGVSQVLPVLVIAYFAPKGSTIILEEPEIHLHPLAQSVLAELFVEISKERGVQFIVETHSEHLFRRMQTLISRKEVIPNDLGMYFVERDKDAANLRTLEVDEFGRVHNWPKNFFGDALGETKEQALHYFERQKSV